MKKLEKYLNELLVYMADEIEEVSGTNDTVEFDIFLI